MKTTILKRAGRCKRCGRCCRMKITISVWKDGELAPNMLIRTRRQLTSALDELGFTVVSVTETHQKDQAKKAVLWRAHVRCRNQLDDGTCSVYRGTRTWFCRDWPCAPEGTPKYCGFKWKKVVR